MLLLFYSLLCLKLFKKMFELKKNIQQIKKIVEKSEVNILYRNDTLT